MYKVFINDQAICFPGDSRREDQGVEIPKGLNNIDIVSFIEKQVQYPVKCYYIKANDAYESFSKFISSFRIIKAAGGVVRKNNANGEILMIYRLGKWDLPKGKLDKGEALEQAAIREVTEECGVSHLTITKKVGDSFHLYRLKGNWVLKQSHWYEMICKDDSPLVPQLEENITEAQWMSEKKIKTILPDCYASISELLKTEILNR